MSGLMQQLIMLFAMILPLLLVAVGLAVLISQLVELQKTHKFRAVPAGILVVTAGYFAGAAVGWWVRPAEWPMSFSETWYATVHSDIYGHTVEHRAEIIGVFQMVCAAAGFAIAAAAFAVYRQVHRQPVATRGF